MAFKKIKQRLRHRRLTKANVKIELDIPSVAYGARSGFWTIAPHLLPRESVVYSAGVGNNIRWDLEMIAHHCALVYAFDPTPRTVEWISEQDLPGRFNFFPLGLSDCDGEIDFIEPNRTYKFNYRSGAVVPPGVRSVACEVRRLATLCKTFDHQGIDVLKMDIEGAEMQALPDMVSSGIFPGQLLVEFHYNYPDIGFDQFLYLIQSLRDNGYRILDISERGYEFSFVHEQLL